MRGAIHWYYDTLTPRMAVFSVVLAEAVDELLQRLAEDVEAYAKEHAPWQDQSGDAREGLTAEAVSEGLFQKAIYLYHTVDYGIWLEIRWSGMYAIIIPTIEHMGPVVMAELHGAMGGMRED